MTLLNKTRMNLAIAPYIGRKNTCKCIRNRPESKQLLVESRDTLFLCFPGLLLNSWRFPRFLYIKVSSID